MLFNPNDVCDFDIHDFLSPEEIAEYNAEASSYD